MDPAKVAPCSRLFPSNCESKFSSSSVEVTVVSANLLRGQSCSSKSVVLGQNWPCKPHNFNVDLRSATSRKLSAFLIDSMSWIVRSRNSPLSFKLHYPILNTRATSRAFTTSQTKSGDRVALMLGQCFRDFWVANQSKFNLREC